jgi:hypothetical protein
MLVTTSCACIIIFQELHIQFYIISIRIYLYLPLFEIDSGIEGGHYRQVMPTLNITICHSASEGGTYCHVSYLALF